MTTFDSTPGRSFPISYAGQPTTLPLDLGGVCSLGMPYYPDRGTGVGLSWDSENIFALVVVDGNIVFSQHRDCSAIDSSDELLDAVVSVVDECQSQKGSGPWALGIGWPGLVSPDGKRAMVTGRWRSAWGKDFIELEAFTRRLKLRCGTRSESEADAGLRATFIRKDAALEAYGLRAVDEIKSALLIRLEADRVTGAQILEGHVCFERPTEVGMLKLSFDPDGPCLLDGPPGSLVQYVSRVGWMAMLREHGATAESWEQHVSLLSEGSPREVAVLNQAANWIVQCLLALSRMEPVERVLLTGTTVCSPLGEHLVKAVQAAARDYELTAAIELSPLDVRFGPAFGAAHAANHAAQIEQLKQELRGEGGGEFSGAIRAARMGQFRSYVCQAVLGSRSPQEPLDREQCVELLGRIVDADDVLLASTAAQLIREWLHPTLDDVVTEQIDNAKRLGRDDVLTKLLLIQRVFQAGGIL